VHKPELDEHWLDPLLTRYLGRVQSPQGLWTRIEAARHERRNRSAGQMAWTLAAALMVVGSLWGVYPRAGRGVAYASCNSGDPVLVRAWIESAVGFDVPLPGALPAPVRLSGAREVPGANPAVLISYRSADRDIALLVSKAEQSVAHERGHRFNGKTSWTLRGQRYSVANPDDFRAACGLCHADRTS